MGLVLQLVNGVPRMVDIVTGGTLFDVDYELPSVLSAGTNFTLPSSKTYIMGAFQLSVFVDGISQLVGVDYIEVSTTQIAFPNKSIGIGSRIRTRG